MLSGAGEGHSGVLVVRGEAGIGKTALLDHARDEAGRNGFTVISICGVESESQFAFAGLYQLCTPLLEGTAALPEPQQAALGVAFGSRSGPAPDRFLVGLAILNLLADAAETAPLLCVVDDAQWLDQVSAQVLAFVARRVSAERLVLLFALRDSADSDGHPFVGLPELRPTALGDADARTLLAGAVRTPLDDDVRDRIIAEARGNPLALLELPAGVPPAGLAGGFDLPDPRSIPHRIEDSFRRRSGSLPEDTRLLLLVAAAEPTGEAGLLWQAAAELGIDPGAAEPAEGAGLIEIDTRVRFRHPLVRSAVYGAAPPADRRRAHGALAAATDRYLEPDRVAWHRARSVPGFDEQVAADLERSAGRARARGGVAASAAFLQQAAELSPDPAHRARRALEAGYAKQEAGASEAARELADLAAAGPLDTLQRARLQLLRAQIAFHLTRGNEVPRMLLDAARTLTDLGAAGLARETYLHALDAATILGDSGDGLGVPEVARAALAAPAPPGAPGPADLLLDGLVATATRGYAAGVPDLRKALTTFDSDRAAADIRRASAGDSQWLWLASRTAAGLYEDEEVYRLACCAVDLARDSGSLASLPAALLMLSITLLHWGELAHAGEAAAEGTAIAEAIGALPLPHAQLVLAAWYGREVETDRMYEVAVEQATARGEGTAVTLAEYARAVLHNGLGNYPIARDAADHASRSHELVHSNLALPELVEAASRAGAHDRAAAATEELDARASASDTPWGLGLAARSRALISSGPAAENGYREAIDLLTRSRAATHLARTHLVYGEWLRREGRRQDARDSLRTAYDLLSSMGAEAFAARAARELRATGERPRKRGGRPTDELTAQELHIARLVATGATSREVGAQLFLSPRTIDAHLRNIFRKLGISSRRQLRKLHLP